MNVGFKHGSVINMIGKLTHSVFLACFSFSAAYDRAKNLSLEFLRQHPVDSGARQCDVCQIIDTMLEKNWTLSFQGDSVMRQNVVGLQCELHRRGFVVTTTSKRTAPYGEWGIWDIITLVVRRQDKPENQAVVKYFSMYRPFDDMVQVRALLAMC